MKTARKLAGALAGMMAIMAATVPVFASGNIEVVPSSDAAHTYNVYQLLSGENLGEDVLWDIKVADDIPGTLWDKLGLKEDERAATQIAHWISDSISEDTDGSFAVTVARAVLSEEGIEADAVFQTGDRPELDDGYYVITSDDAQPMLVLIGNGETLTISEKSSVPKMDKEIGEVSYKGEVTYGDAADTGIGKVVPYRITGTLPSNYNAYDSYTYNFRDMFDPCLVVTPESVTAKVIDKEGKEIQDITEKAAIDITETTLSVCFDNLMDAYPSYTEGDVIRVDYEVMITDKASVGYDPNENHAWIEYTRSPTNEELGKSEPDRCRLYTWELDLKKLASDTGKVLEGAEFTVTDEAGRYVNTDGSLTDSRTEKSVWKTDSNGFFKVVEVDTGTYTVTETKAPEGYQSVGAFTVTLAADYQDENNVVITAESKGVRAVIEMTDAKTGISILSVTDIPDNPPPKTGDNTNIIIYVLLGILAVLGLGASIMIFRDNIKKK